MKIVVFEMEEWEHSACQRLQSQHTLVCCREALDEVSEAFVRHLPINLVPLPKRLLSDEERLKEALEESFVAGDSPAVTHHEMPAAG
jgi:hypothetical protein